MLLFLLCLVMPSAFALYSSQSGVVELNSQNFNRLVTGATDDELWLVEFYAPWCGHCKALVPEYEKAARALKGVIKVGAVNADEDKALGSKYGVRGFPTIKLFVNGKAEEYSGPRTAKGLVDAGLAALKQKVEKALNGGSGGSGDTVVELTDGNFDKLVVASEEPWLVEFYAPWCGHCKNLAPHWEKAAAELQGKMKLGALDATVHTIKAQKYGVQGYPTIKYFPGGKASKQDALDYDGGRTSSDIVNWAMDKVTINIPPPAIVQIVDADSFRKGCDAPLCVVTVLPHIFDCQSKCRNQYLSVLKELGDKYKTKLWGWLWTEAGAQTQLEEALEMGGFGYPAMAVVNAKKMKYSLLRGAFSKDGINEFLRDLSYGRGSTAPVRGGELPRIHDGLTAWDGKDADLPVEEEIDLSDVDLDDERDEL